MERVSSGKCKNLDKHKSVHLGESTDYPFHSPWWFLSILGGEMQRVNAYRFYDLGMKIHPLTGVGQGQNIQALVPALILAYDELLQFLNYLPFKVCEPAARKLLEAIESILPRDSATGKIRDDISKSFLAGNLTIDFYRAYALMDNARRFETILSAKLPTLDMYFVSQKGAYSTPDLIEHAEVVFPESIQKLLSERIIFDVREAGRCLVLNSPTAAGFHILRATESVIREYLTVVVTSSTSRSKNRDWGAYIKTLTGAGVDPKITSMLDQIRGMHRNPLMHPEDSLNDDEAMELFDICKSAIQMLMRDILKRNKSGASLPIPPPPTPPSP